MPARNVFHDDGQALAEADADRGDAQRCPEMTIFLAGPAPTAEEDKLLADISGRVND